MYNFFAFLCIITLSSICSYELHLVFQYLWNRIRENWKVDHQDIKGINPIIIPILSQKLQKMFFAEKTFSGSYGENVSQNIRGLRVLEPLQMWSKVGGDDRDLPLVFTIFGKNFFF